jgi:hypothetical protein
LVVSSKSLPAWRWRPDRGSDKKAVAARLADTAREAGAADPEQLGEQLALLIDAPRTAPGYSTPTPSPPPPPSPPSSSTTPSPPQPAMTGGGRKCRVDVAPRGRAGRAARRAVAPAGTRHQPPATRPGPAGFCGTARPPAVGRSRSGRGDRRPAKASGVRGRHPGPGVLARRRFAQTPAHIRPYAVAHEELVRSWEVVRMRVAHQCHWWATRILTTSTSRRLATPSHPLHRGARLAEQHGVDF